MHVFLVGLLPLLAQPLNFAAFLRKVQPVILWLQLQGIQFVN